MFVRYLLAAGLKVNTDKALSSVQTEPCEMRCEECLHADVLYNTAYSRPCVLHVCLCVSGRRRNVVNVISADRLLHDVLPKAANSGSGPCAHG